MNPATPTRVIGGRYVVLAELGRGGMGVVWRAQDRVMGRHVAVKELHLPDGLRPDERALFRERLLREARTAGRLADPGVVTVFDVISDEGVDHIVMELVEAPTLADIVESSGPLDERTVTSVAGQLLTVLRVAHENGVVHRDVKPSNVMLGRDGRVRLADFGIAQAADDPRLTASGAVIGSPAYMSPERLEGAPATPASDLWALGVTLYHALRGDSPFGRDSTAATIYAVLHADVPPVRTRGPLGSVMSGLLQRDPQARLSGQQAMAMLTDSSGAAKTSTTGGVTAQVDVREPATGPLAAVPPRRGRWWWLVAAALVLGLAAGAVGGYMFGRSGGPAVTTMTYGDGGDVPVFTASTETCLPGQLAPGRSFPSGATVSCDEPHDLEVFATYNPFGVTDPVPYPGRAQLAGYAASVCSLTFGSALIGGPDKDRLEVAGLVPSRAAFESVSSSATFSSRDVICLLRRTDGTQLTGSRIVEAPG